ncbi:MAG: flagellar biosynthetic protein FliQ [Alphaproteobacteria bacterium]|nr:flagellar biosynthetic protein FliQ [Alphaproteobacteria bacterium]
MMASTEVLAFAANRMLIEALILISPPLAAVLLVGLAVSLIQVGTRMTDLTLGFVPRFAVILLVTALTLPWMGERLSAYFHDCVAQAADRF